jgi:hypothetical protein
MTNTTFAVGGDIEVRRLGFGGMRITGPGFWGPPRDRAAARALLRWVVDLGVRLIDTADAYGRRSKFDPLATGHFSGVADTSGDARRLIDRRGDDVRFSATFAGEIAEAVDGGPER